MEPTHEPVLLTPVVDLLDPSRGGLFVDCTVGLGGHARAVLDGGAARLLGLDRDPNALDLAARALAPWHDRVELVHADYRELPAILAARGIDAIDGALADLGVSSMQFDAPGRGFSFRRDEPLDMRMDQTQGPTAAELVADADESDLADVIYRYGEERFSRRIARRIVEARGRSPIVTTTQLADIVRHAIPRKGYQRIDPATRTFQALRIWVNRELEGLDVFLTATASLLRRGARFAVITFHSLEDRVVKHTFRALAAGEAAVRLLTRKPVVPDEHELARNPRARSAKLRAIERLA
ncbi:MAG: 16S rRNA (cytosine(1402)-N(4))-methyltransferase RsmH [Vicinamibacterales bacterium]